MVPTNLLSDCLRAITMVTADSAAYAVKKVFQRISIANPSSDGTNMVSSSLLYSSVEKVL